MESKRTFYEEAKVSLLLLVGCSLFMALGFIFYFIVPYGNGLCWYDYSGLVVHFSPLGNFFRVLGLLLIFLMGAGILINVLEILQTSIRFGVKNGLIAKEREMNELQYIQKKKKEKKEELIKKPEQKEGEETKPGILEIPADLPSKKPTKDESDGPTNVWG